MSNTSKIQVRPGFLADPNPTLKKITARLKKAGLCTSRVLAPEGGCSDYWTVYSPHPIKTRRALEDLLFVAIFNSKFPSSRSY